jgi:hypothetical protein
MSTGKRLAKRSIIGTRVCAQGEDGKFYSGVIHAVKTPGNSDGFTNTAGETRYSVRFDPLPGNKRLVTAMREYKEAELIGPGFQAVTGFRLLPGQKVFLTYNGREISGEVTSHQPQIDEVIVNIIPPGYEVSIGYIISCINRVIGRASRPAHTFYEIWKKVSKAGRKVKAYSGL